jgi:hypothetical protein
MTDSPISSVGTDDSDDKQPFHKTNNKGRKE